MSDAEKIVALELKLELAARQIEEQEKALAKAEQILTHIKTIVDSAWSEG